MMKEEQPADTGSTDWDVEDQDAWANIGSATNSQVGMGTALPFVSDAVREELEQEGPPNWLGQRWREIQEPGEKRDAWVALREWVDWFIREYRQPESVIPPCWYEHKDIVAELYAAMCAEYKIWEEGAPGLGPMTTWNMHVNIMGGRLRAMVASTTCIREKRHVPDTGYGDLPAFVLSYDQQRWAAVRDGVLDEATVPRSDTVVSWRAVGVNSEGQIVMGEPIRVGGVPDATPLTLTGTTVASAAAKDTIRLESFISGENIQELTWESSTDDMSWNTLLE